MAPPRPPVLVSACLLGQAVRHDGRDKRSDHPVLRAWLAQGRVLPLCPELAGGLSVPRLPAEIEAGAGGAAVVAGRARVLDVQGGDVTAAFLRGAEAALALVRQHGVRVAVLKAGSPSCGSAWTYDGRFQGGRTDQPGVTAAVLRAAGVQVFSEEEWLAAERVDAEAEGSTPEAPVP
ncbi:purine nucleoside phosphorylase [beta proteobacterium AAP121]|nr:purine nucleoside phosphorylase [beta proteobacterium AAP65]KPF94531.1 purine nucleoside phosphorylase [beta proteobacterium AAP121]